MATLALISLALSEAIARLIGSGQSNIKPAEFQIAITARRRSLFIDVGGPGITGSKTKKNAPARHVGAEDDPCRMPCGARVLASRR